MSRCCSTVARCRASSTAALLIATALAAAAPNVSRAQDLDKQTVSRGHTMLAQIYADLRKFYYDSTFGGRDLAARYRAADSSISAAPSDAHVYGAIAQFLMELEDSHTAFVPPSRVAKVDYGYSARFVGDTCFIVDVRKGSDAEAKGLKPGDALLVLDVFRVERPTFHTLQYVYGALSPRTGVRLTVKSPGAAAPRVVEALAKVTMGERVIDLRDATSDSWRRVFDALESSAQIIHRTAALGDSVVVWRMSSFAGEDNANIDAIMKQVRKVRALVLDLRNNGGGAQTTLNYLIGQLVDHDVTVGTERSREGEKQWVAKRSTGNPYRGKLVVLVNSGSASAAELFARVMQLEGRGPVVGDRSMGAVVLARFYPHRVGFGKVVNYSTEISVADIVMSDGKRLEKAGVTPDHVVLPTGADIAAGRDPALVKALALAGVAITPEQAGRLFSTDK